MGKTFRNRKRRFDDDFDSGIQNLKKRRKKEKNLRDARRHNMRTTDQVETFVRDEYDYYDESSYE